MKDFEESKKKNTFSFPCIAVRQNAPQDRGPLQLQTNRQHEREEDNIQLTIKVRASIIYRKYTEYISIQDIYDVLWLPKTRISATALAIATSNCSLYN